MARVNNPRRFTIYAGADFECGGVLLLPFHGGNAGSIPARATMLPCWTWLKMLAGPSALMGKSYLLKWME